MTSDRATRHEVRRLRRETRRRTLVVTDVVPLGSTLLRIMFSCDDLADFDSAAADDHVKLFLPGSIATDGTEAKRDYTPRAFDRAAGSLTIDFALHGDGGGCGPATAWARNAIPGDVLQIGGPRGSTVIADDFDWYLLVGDETAIPAICRRIEELRHDAAIEVVVSIVAGADRPPVPDHPRLTLRWSERDAVQESSAALLATLDDLALPDGDGFVWIAAEASVARAVRTWAIGVRHHPPEWVKASGYWVAGEGGARTRIDED